MELFNKQTLQGTFLVSFGLYPATTFGLELAPVTLNLYLYQLPVLMSHFMHNKESYQGPHLGLLSVLNLEHTLKP